MRNNRLWGWLLPLDVQHEATRAKLGACYSERISRGRSFTHVHTQQRRDPGRWQHYVFPPGFIHDQARRGGRTQRCHIRDRAHGRTGHIAALDAGIKHFHR